MDRNDAGRVPGPAAEGTQQRGSQEGLRGPGIQVGDPSSLFLDLRQHALRLTYQLEQKLLNNLGTAPSMVTEEQVRIMFEVRDKIRYLVEHIGG